MSTLQGSRACSVALSGIGNQEGTEAVCIPISGQQYLEAVQGGAFSASPRAMAVLASLNQHDIVTSVAAGTARSGLAHDFSGAMHLVLLTIGFPS